MNRSNIRDSARRAGYCPPLGRRSGLLIAAIVAVVGPSAPVDVVAQTGGTKAAVRADVVKPVRRPLTRGLNLPATLVADEQVDLFAKASGYIGKIDIDIGDRVKKGDVLAVIDIPEMLEELKQVEALLEAKQAKVRALQAMVVQAERNVDTARSEVQRFTAQQELDAINLKRKQELREGNAIPQQALDEALSAAAISNAQLSIAGARVAGAQAEHLASLADVKVAESDVAVGRADLARLNTLMQYASIRAPFDGVITVRNVDHGTFVRSAAEGVTIPLLQIAKTDRIRVVIEVPEVDAPFVRPGTPVMVDVKALGRGPTSAAVSRIAGAIKPETRTMRVEVDLDNPDGSLTPGMYAKVTVQLESKSAATMIPSKAIRMEGKQTVLYVVASGVAKSLPVTIGYDDGIWAEVLSGLSGNEDVITATSGTVTIGAAVQAVPSGS